MSESSVKRLPLRHQIKEAIIERIDGMSTNRAEAKRLIEGLRKAFGASG